MFDTTSYKGQNFQEVQNILWSYFIFIWRYKVLNSLCWYQELIMKIGLDVLTLNRKRSLLKHEAIWKLLSLVSRLQACLQVAVKIKCEIWKAPLPLDAWNTTSNLRINLVNFSLYDGFLCCEYLPPGRFLRCPMLVKPHNNHWQFLYICTECEYEL